MYLRNEAVGKGNPYDAGDERCATQEEEVPVEASRLFERELFRLSGDAAHVLQLCQSKDLQTCLSTT